MNTRNLTAFQHHCLRTGASFVSWRMPGDKLPVTIPGTPRFLDEGSLPATEKGFIFSPFNKQSTSLWFKAEMAIRGNEVEEGYFIYYGNSATAIDNSSDIENSNYIPVDKVYSTVLPAETSKDEYLRSFTQMMEAIQSGRIQKGVLSRITRIPFNYQEETPLLFNSLCYSFPQAFVYLLSSPVTGIWIGASPELLLATGGSRITTMALAGTRPAGTPGQWGAKEQEEQNWVAKFINEKLHESDCIGIEQSAAYTANAGSVEHIRTDFRAILKGTSPDVLLKIMHPTPAVCGWPSEEAAIVISETEKHNRTYYTGFLGPVNMEQKTSLFVNLRCMQADDKEAAIYAGGGITIDSEADKEWEETSIKSLTLLGEIEKIRNLAE